VPIWSCAVQVQSRVLAVETRTQSETRCERYSSSSHDGMARIDNMGVPDQARRLAETGDSILRYSRAPPPFGMKSDLDIAFSKRLMSQALSIAKSFSRLCRLNSTNSLGVASCLVAHNVGRHGYICATGHSYLTVSVQSTRLAAAQHPVCCASNAPLGHDSRARARQPRRLAPAGARLSPREEAPTAQMENYLPA
jgi:hypothetical protein